MADYSYGFVVKSLAPVLERLGHWRQVIAPESCLIHAAAQAIEEGFRPVHLAVMPVHAAYLTPAVPTILFPFWEFPRIPDRDFGWETRQNWARVARRASLIVTACEMTARVVPPGGRGVPGRGRPGPRRGLGLPRPSLVSGFHLADRRVVTSRGEARRSIPASRRLPIRFSPPGRLAGWRGRREGPVQTARKALAPPQAQQWVSQSKRATLHALRRRGAVAVEPLPRFAPRLSSLSGLVYTSVFNLGDLRKNPHDLITAFLLAFKDRPDVTLVLKLATTPETEVHHVEHLRHTCLGYGIEHQCRVVVIADYLSDDELLGLFRATTFYVNTSRAEGACLPLQQALACGRPGDRAGAHGDGRLYG